MPCLICRYFQPTEPAEHKTAREAGTCEKHCGNKWDNHTAIRYIKSHGGLIEGWCRRHPAPMHVKNHGHYCGDISVYDYFFKGWGVAQFEAGTGMFEWAQQALNTVINGKNDWVVRRNRELEERNAELQRQLKAARKVSASRLKRLEKAKSQEELKPFVPRLVAAE